MNAVYSKLAKGFLLAVTFVCSATAAQGQTIPAAPQRALYRADSSRSSSRSLADWIKAHGGEAIRRRFTYHTTLTSCLDEFAEEDKQTNGARLGRRPIVGA